MSDLSSLLKNWCALYRVLQHRCVCIIKASRVIPSDTPFEAFGQPELQLVSSIPLVSSHALLPASGRCQVPDTLNCHVLAPQ